MKIEAVIKD